MGSKRKISVRKILQSVLTLVLVTVCVIVISGATKQQKQRSIADVKIFIENGQYGFVTEEDVKDVLYNSHVQQLSDVKMADVDLGKMEHVVAANPWVSTAEVHVDNEYNVIAKVVQRVPEIRIFEKEGNSYYLDRNVEAMPLSTKFHCYTTVVTNVPKLKDDSAGQALKSDIVKLVRFINKDSFWSAQVSQVIVRDDRSFEIVPVLGKQKIIIGDVNDLDKKFGNLFTFYSKVLNKIGWDKYERFDLSYNGQLVASPALDWKLPNDKVMNRINWVNSILGEEYKPQVTVSSSVTNVLAQTPTAEKPVSIEAEVKVVEQLEAKEKKELPVKVMHEEIAEVKQPEPVKKEVVKAEKKEEKKSPKYIYTGANN